MSKTRWSWYCGATLTVLACGCATTTSLDLDPAWSVDPVQAERSDAPLEGAGEVARAPRESTTASSAESRTLDASSPAPIADGQDGASAASSGDMNKSNNPLTPAPGIGLQDYYTPHIYDTDGHS